MTERQKRRKQDAETRAGIEKLLPTKKPLRQRRRRASLLKRKDDADAVAQRGARLEQIRESLSLDMRAWMSSPVKTGRRRFLQLRQDTGVGKTETTVTELDFLVHLSAHGDLADEAFARAEGKGHSAMRWRARSWGWEDVLEMAHINPDAAPTGISDQGRERLIDLCFPEDAETPARAMCAFNDDAERLVRRGYQISDVLCRRCPARDACRQKGYLSQFELAAAAHQLFIALPELQLVSDRSYKNWAELIDPDKEKVAVIDDVAAARFAPVRTVSLFKIKKLLSQRADAERETGDVPASIQFLSELEVRIAAWATEKKSGDGAAAAETERALREFIGGFDLGAVVRELSKIPVRLRVREDAIEDIPSGARISGSSLLPCRGSARLVDVLEKWIFHQGDAAEAQTRAFEKEIWELLFGKDAIDVPSVRELLATMPVRLSLLEQVIDELVAGAVFPPQTLKKIKDEQAVVRWWGNDAIGTESEMFMSVRRAFGAGLVNAQNAPLVVDPQRGWAAALREGDAGIRLAIGEDGTPQMEIALRPRLNFERTIASSATSSPDDFKDVLAVANSRIDFQVSPAAGPERAAWEDGCRVYQISTARFTNTSFFKKKGGAVVGPGARLRDAVDFIVGQAAVDKVLVVGRADLTSDALRAETERLLTHEQIVFRNYREIVGLDNFSDFGCAVLFLPTPGPEELMQKALRLYRGDFYSLDFETRVDGKVAIAGMEPVPMKFYRDEKVQRLAHDAITSDFYQAAMRLRPNLLPDKAIVILSAFPVNGLTNRADTVFFDWHHLDGLLDIRDIDTSESVRELLDRGVSIGDLAKELGISNGHARRLRGPVDKRARDAEVRRRRASGETYSQIAKAVGISEPTVSRILKK